ncbi:MULTISPECIES: hypothetical protein [unclassified Robertmurraya]|jgi:hypothetical protein|uniref:hypothetical protein n=1 Tax=unclassified Robertmurraya TaxID=2837524 RepID=UPI000E6B2DC8|nr:hypothetical protein [Bacillus sp. Y1]AYA76702.1 hypothetical protein DOE78_15320 [Bacillus sp. Y1]
MKKVLEGYRSLWNNRLLNEGDDEDVLREAISRELKDEFSHPRVRKQPHEKYYLATKRVIDSDIESDLKLSLLTIHVEEMEKILSVTRKL